MAESWHPSPGPAPASSAFSVSSQVRPSVDVVLLNWNGWQDTLECLRSLRRMDYRAWRALVVDNGSTDDSVPQLRQACPEVTIIETRRNLGFAAGNNVGIRAALETGADYVFVLNNDTTVSPQAVTDLVAFAESHPEAALMGPKITRVDPQREWPIRRKLDLLTMLCTLTALRRLLVRLPLVRDLFYCTDKQPSIAQVLSGSALFFRAAAFEKVGLFDESTFLDFEELIMAEKIRNAGLSTYFVPQAVIWHKGSASAAKLRAKRYIENARSEEYFLSHYVRLSSVGRSMVKLVRFLTYGVRALRYRNYREHFPEFLDALRSRQSVKA
jgi:GT2 family glycosyltransferase